MSYEGSSPITSRWAGSQGRQESTHPTPPCLLRECLGWASSSASILLPRELDIQPSAWKGNSANFAVKEFSEVRSSLVFVEVRQRLGDGIAVEWGCDGRGKRTRSSSRWEEYPGCHSTCLVAVSAVRGAGRGKPYPRSPQWAHPG